MSVRYNSVAELPSELAMFPLRGVILLPRSQLPLNVFEPRYLAMLDDAISGSRLIGIIQPDEGSEESPRSADVPLKKVGCAGRLTGYQELEDGRLLITLTGVMRFAMVAEQNRGKPYRVWQVDWQPFADDLQRSKLGGALDRDVLLKVLKSYLDAHKLRADWKAIAAAPSELLINALCVSSPFGPEEKQALLEATTLVQRGEVLMTLARMDIAGGPGVGGGTLQ